MLLEREKKESPAFMENFQKGLIQGSSISGLNHIAYLLCPILSYFV